MTSGFLDRTSDEHKDVGASPFHGSIA